MSSDWTWRLWPARREEPKPETVTLNLDRWEAHEHQQAIADVLCWVDGLRAGIAMATDYGSPDVDGPSGIEQLRKLNTALKDAVNLPHIEEEIPF